MKLSLAILILAPAIAAGFVIVKTAPKKARPAAPEPTQVQSFISACATNRVSKVSVKSGILTWEITGFGRLKLGSERVESKGQRVISDGVYVFSATCNGHHVLVSVTKSGSSSSVKNSSN